VDEDDVFDDEGDPGEYESDNLAVADEGFGRLVAGAWRDWYGGRPEPGGLAGMLLEISRNSPEGRAGRPADAIGVSGSTWNNWLLYARGMTDKRGNRLGTKPSKASEAKIRAALRKLRYTDGPLPTTLVIKAVIVWNRYQNGRQDPLSAAKQADFSKVRTVRFGPGLELGEARDRWAAGRDTASAQAILDELHAFYGVPIDILEAVSVRMEA